MHPLDFLIFVGNRRIPLDMLQIRTWMGSLWQLPLICQILIHLMEGKHHLCRLDRHLVKINQLMAYQTYSYQ